MLIHEIVKEVKSELRSLERNDYAQWIDTALSAGFSSDEIKGKLKKVLIRIYNDEAVPVPIRDKVKIVLLDLID